LIRAAFLSLATLFGGLLFAQHEAPAAPDTAADHGQVGHSAEAQEFKAGELIMGHIADEHRAGQAPKGLQSLVEPIILFVRDDVAKSAIGEHKYMKFMPYLLTAFFFIFLNNLMGLVPFFPGGANLTGNIAITLVLALITFVIVTVNGNKHYWGHILAMPGVPAWVLASLHRWRSWVCS
jgi:hypothetical protein